ncbi:MAG: acyl-CoA dehydrogenase family protein [bacterium]|nr:acyl-CoA dehydrogenase family protein [bacterium]
MAPTHEVLNQVPARTGINEFTEDAVLRRYIEVFGSEAHTATLTELGERAGSNTARAWGETANARIPTLSTHDRYGNRVDEVIYDDNYHHLMGVATSFGLHGAPWASSYPGAHVARAAGFILWSQAEAGHMCPISMTYASIPALRTDPEAAARWIPGLTERAYDPTLAPPASKPALLAGMAMTEKQGGSDVRANTTTAVAAGDHYLLTGHKWFCSAPMSDLFLVLAHAEGGLTCFVVPRVLDDGTRTTFRLQRLKDKLGNRSNASSEVEFEDTIGFRLGDEGRGVKTIVEMVSATRLDCVLGSAALMRAAVNQATWHAEHRAAFGKLLVDQPLMRSVLDDLELETEAAIALGLRLANAVDDSEAGSEPERLFRRIALPAAKYHTTKRAMSVTGEALECLGGNGYVEESGMPRLYREAPVNSVWEGSGNVNALDLLRAVSREEGVIETLVAELNLARGTNSDFDIAAKDLEQSLHDAKADPAGAEAHARFLAERVATCLQAGLLLRYSTSDAGDRFSRTRLSSAGMSFGAHSR